jgi:hypothetical protein
MRAVLEKRNAVLKALQEFRNSLDYAQSAHDVMCLVHQVRECLVFIQRARSWRRRQSLFDEASKNGLVDASTLP